MIAIWFPVSRERNATDGNTAFRRTSDGYHIAGIPRSITWLHRRTAVCDPARGPRGASRRCSPIGVVATMDSLPMAGGPGDPADQRRWRGDRRQVADRSTPDQPGSTRWPDLLRGSQRSRDRQRVPISFIDRARRGSVRRRGGGGSLRRVSGADICHQHLPAARRSSGPGGRCPCLRDRDPRRAVGTPLHLPGAGVVGQPGR